MTRGHGDRTADLAATLAYAADLYLSHQRTLTPAGVALRATAAELARVLVGLAESEGLGADEAARSLALALATAMRGQSTAGVVARLRATADWLEQRDPVRVQTPADVPAALATVQQRRAS